MLMSIATTILARWQLSLGILAALVLTHGLAYCEGREDGKNAAEAAQAALDLKATQNARKADAVAAETVTKGQTDVEQANQRAREAADGSSDPLASFADSLRGREAGANNATSEPR